MALSREVDIRRLPTSSDELYEQFGLTKQKKIRKIQDKFEVLSGRGNLPLSHAVGELVDKPVFEPFSDFKDGELCLGGDEDQPLHNVPNLRGAKLMFLQSGYPNPNTGVMEMFFMASAANRADVQDVTIFSPYFPYGRGDKKDRKRGAIAGADVAELLEFSGVRRINTIDIHADQLAGAIRRPWDFIYASKVLVPAIQNAINESSDDLDTKMGSADEGGLKRARRYARQTGVSERVVWVDKERNHSQKDQSTSNGVYGDIEDKRVIIVDDICSTGGTLLKAGKLLKEHGAREVWTAVTHGVFVPDDEGKTFVERIHEPDSPINKLFVTDTIFQGADVRNSEKVEVVSVAPMIAVAILCYIRNKSISERLID